jgi:hypothetical protein
VIYQGPDTKLPEDALWNSWVDNPDGGGFAYIDHTNTIQVFKSMNYDDFEQAYELAHKEHGEFSPFVIHLRWATHGVEDVTNVHPFQVGSGPTFIAHNGILPVKIPKGDKRSDTRVFVEDYVANLPLNWLDVPELVHLVENFTSGSKLVVLTTNPALEFDVYILNEEDGHWSSDGQDIWYSNHSYISWKGKGRGTVTSQVEAEGAWGATYWDEWGELKPAPTAPTSLVPAATKNFPTVQEYLAARYGEKEDGDKGDEWYPCLLCGGTASSTGLCPICEWCNRCDLPDEDCECYSGAENKSIHDLTDAELASLDR